MKKSLIISMIASTFIVGALDAKESYMINEEIKVSSCDNFHWCKTDEGYVKLYQLKKTDKENVYKAKVNNLVIYNKVSEHKHDKFTAFLNKIQNNEKKYLSDYEYKNFKYDYIKKSILNGLEATIKKIDAKEELKKPKAIVKEPAVVEVKKVEKPKAIVKEPAVVEVKKVEKPKEIVKEPTVVEVKEVEIPEEIVEKSAVVEVNEVTETEKANNFFIIATLNYNSLDVSQTDNKDKAKLSDGSDDKDGIGGSIGIGYTITPNIFTTLKYSTTSLDNVTINNLLVGINYQFINTPAHPYIGLSIGSSTLTWDNDVVDKVEEVIDNKSEKTAFGMQVGAEYSINTKWSVIGEYQLLMQEHTTKISSPVVDTELNHKMQNIVNIGFKYSF